MALVREKVAGIEEAGERTVENSPVVIEQARLRQCCHVAAEIHISIKSRRLGGAGLARAGGQGGTVFVVCVLRLLNVSSSVFARCLWMNMKVCAINQQ